MSTNEPIPRRGLKGGIAALGVALVLALLLVCAVAAHVAGVADFQFQAQSAAAQNAQQCTDASDVDTTQLTSQVNRLLEGSNDIHVSGLSEPKEQLSNAKAIVAVGVQLHVPARGQIIALATALQESGLRNISYGDRDSVGLFQQRPSQGWGTRSQLMTPVYAAKKFYSALKSVKNWQQMPLTVAAQKVQKSGRPSAYAPHEPLATALQKAIAPSLGAAADTGQSTLGATPVSLGCAGGDPSDGTQYGAIKAGTLPKNYTIPATTKPAARTAIQWALQQLGGPYQWGGSCTSPRGNQPQQRCDCSSLMQRAYGVAGRTISRTTYTQIHDGTPIPPRADALQPGDLVFTEGTAARPEHVAMALGHGLVVHAPRPGRVIEVAALKTHGRILAVSRIA